MRNPEDMEEAAMWPQDPFDQTPEQVRASIEYGDAEETSLEDTQAAIGSAT